MSGDEAHAPRLLIFHKQATSGRTRFLQWGGETVCAFSPLPPLTAILDGAPEVVPLVQTQELVKRATGHLGLRPDALEHEAEFRQYLDLPGGPVPVLLLALTTIDPPFEKVEAKGGKFIALTEARHLPSTELELLRRAYCVIMEG